MALTSQILDLDVFLNWKLSETWVKLLNFYVLDLTKYLASVSQCSLDNYSEYMMIQLCC